jgi:pimeloyl-ACP methyl ester carboxylesterase
MTTSLLEVPDGLLEFTTTGSGVPATVFAHGLAGSIQTTRPFGSGVRGSRTFMHFRGHGGSAAPETPWT